MPGDMPEEVLVAIELMGNNVRTEILRRLSRQPSTAHELAERIEVHAASVHRHLVLLEEHHLVSADVEPAERRRFQTVTWQTHRGRVAELGRLWADYASGADPLAE